MKYRPPPPSPSASDSWRKLDKIGWWDVSRLVRPDITWREFEEMWREFENYKAKTRAKTKIH